MSEIGGRLAAILRAGSFAVSGEVVPPRSGDGGVVADHARALVGSVDAANVTDNPTGSAHMSGTAGAALVARAGLEPTVQLTVRDRNRLALTSELLGAWAMGARNVLCLSGDPLHLGDHPDAATVGDLDVPALIRLARGLREGVTMGGSEVSDPPRYLVGAADMPLADPYDPARLAAKLDAGAEVIWTQITYDVEALASWMETMRTEGFLERARFLVGVAPLRSAKAARFMDEKLPGVRVPPPFVEALETAGGDAEAVGLDLTVQVVRAIEELDGVAGVHIMGMGRDDLVRATLTRAGLFPRPTSWL